MVLVRVSRDVRCYQKAQCWAGSFIGAPMFSGMSPTPQRQPTQLERSEHHICLPYKRKTICGASVVPVSTGAGCSVGPGYIARQFNRMLSTASRLV